MLSAPRLVRALSRPAARLCSRSTYRVPVTRVQPTFSALGFAYAGKRTSISLLPSMLNLSPATAQFSVRVGTKHPVFVDNYPEFSIPLEALGSVAVDAEDLSLLPRDQQLVAHQNQKAAAALAAGNLPLAFRLFNEMTNKQLVPNLTSYHLAMKGLLIAGHPRNVISVYRELKQVTPKITPTLQTIHLLLKAYALVGSLQIADVITSDVIQQDLKPDQMCRFLASESFFRAGYHNTAIETIVSGLNKGEKLSFELFQLFWDAVCRLQDGLLLHPLFHSATSAYPKQFTAEMYERALNLFITFDIPEAANICFLRLAEHNAVLPQPTYLAVARCFARHAKFQECETVVDRMKQDGWEPSRELHDAIARAYARDGDWKMAIWKIAAAAQAKAPVLSETYEELSGLLSRNGRFLDNSMKYLRVLHTEGTRIPDDLLATIVDAVSYNSSFDDTLKLSREIDAIFSANPTAITYNALIRVACQEKKAETAVDLLHKMRAEGLKPLASTFGTVILTAVNAEMLDHALDVFDLSVKDGVVLSEFQFPLTRLIFSLAASGNDTGAKSVIHRLALQMEKQIAYDPSKMLFARRAYDLGRKQYADKKTGDTFNMFKPPPDFPVRELRMGPAPGASTVRDSPVPARESAPGSH